MIGHASMPYDRRSWTFAGAVALLGHISIALLVLAWARHPQTPVPEPVVLVELPPMGTPEAQVAAATTPTPPQPAVAATNAPSPMDVPPARMPVPSSAVILPTPTPVQAARPSAPATASPANLPVATAAPVANGSLAATATDPRAKKQEADYFAMVSAHLNRRKVYPAEAKQARQQGVVTVRFTVDRSGSVSGVSIKRSSGHDILDRATLDLVQRVAPMPRMPSSMQRDSVTLSLPIDYSLRTI